MSRYRVWTTGQGEKIPINKMTDKHLINTIIYLETKARARMEVNLFACYGCAFQGEMAQFEQDNAIERIETMLDKEDWELMMSPDIYKIYWDMVLIANKKGLT